MRRVAAVAVLGGALSLGACGGSAGAAAGPNAPVEEAKGGGSGGGPGSGSGGGGLGTRAVFPADNPWNQDISTQPVDPNSAALIDSCGGAPRRVHADFGTVWNGAPNGIPCVLVVDRLAWKLYELFDAHPLGGGTSWHAGSGAVFDLTSNALRPAGWTSADAAGLPIFPGLVRYDEAVTRGAITHALRFTCPTTRRAYVSPARHWASSQTSASYPPMGMRVRLKASVDISAYPAEVRVILTALETYGMVLADTGSGFFISGAPDPRRSDDNLATMGRLTGADFEVVRMGTIVTS